MARKAKDCKLESRTARSKLAVRFKTYTGPTLARGIQLLYRRNKTNGTWVVKAADGHGSYWTKGFAFADDFEDADGKSILTFYQACDRAKTLARGSDDEVASDAAPITVDGALTAYERDLEKRGGSKYNATYPRTHLTTVLLAKPVALVTKTELATWHDGLRTKLADASVNRLCKGLLAAVKLAAKNDRRIKNLEAWQHGLEALPDAHVARNVVLPDAQVLAFVGAGYALDAKLGEFVDVLAETGARPSQPTRLLVEDLHVGAKPKLMMPKAGKGGSKNRMKRKQERYSVPISLELAAKLAAAAKGRAPDAPLLLRSDGQRWSERPSDDYREDVKAIVTSIGEDPEKVTMYALRHSSIVRALLRNEPIRLVASRHNTSVAEIERTYSKHITEYSDDIARNSLLAREHADNVIPFEKAA
ncbi:site-specific integrase [Bradyrhizobium sp. USDA 313]|uniref:site-specific integrase n=1 Tax=Bradyrhizobium sp. USDA 313 TaxID=3156307 RepID=UPI00351630DF